MLLTLQFISGFRIEKCREKQNWYRAFVDRFGMISTTLDAKLVVRNISEKHANN